MGAEIPEEEGMKKPEEMRPADPEAYAREYREALRQYKIDMAIRMIASGMPVTIICPEGREKTDESM